MVCGSVCLVHIFITMVEDIQTQFCFLMRVKIGLDFRFYIKAAHVYFYIHMSSTHLALSHLLILMPVCKCTCVCFIAPSRKEFMYLGLYEQLNESVSIILNPDTPIHHVVNHAIKYCNCRMS